MLDGKDVGKTPSGFEMDVSADYMRGSKPIVLTLDNYETLSTMISVEPSYRSIDKQYVLAALKGDFEITSVPDGATVFIDGLVRGTTPLRGSLPSGTYDVYVALDDQLTLPQELVVGGFTTGRLQFELIGVEAASLPVKSERVNSRVDNRQPEVQQPNLRLEKSRDEYLKMAKKRKTVGIALLTVGLGALGTGVGMMAGNWDSAFFEGKANSIQNWYIGLAAGSVVGIPLSIIGSVSLGFSTKYRKQAEIATRPQTELR
jgi:hypothetical protein